MFGDCLLDRLSVVGIIMVFISREAFERASGGIDWHADDVFVPSQALYDAVADQRFWLAFTFFISSSHLFQSLAKVFEGFSLMCNTVRIIIGKLIQSFISFLLLMLLTFCLINYALESLNQYEQRTFTFGLLAQIEQLLGGGRSFQDLNESMDQRNFWLSVFIMLMFIVVMVVIVMNLIVTILIDMYESVAQKAAADWCLSQAQDLLEFGRLGNRRAALFVRAKTKKSKKSSEAKTGNDGTSQAPTDVDSSQSSTSSDA